MTKREFESNRYGINTRLKDIKTNIQYHFSGVDFITGYFFVSYFSYSSHTKKFHFSEMEVIE